MIPTYDSDFCSDRCMTHWVRDTQRSCFDVPDSFVVNRRRTAECLSCAKASRMAGP